MSRADVRAASANCARACPSLTNTNHHISCHQQLRSAIFHHGSLQRKATSYSTIHISKARVSDIRSATATLLQLTDTSAADHPSHQHTLLLKYFTMLFTYNHIAIIASISIFTNALPLDTKPRDLAPRQKNYSVINVDGGSSEVAQATPVIKPTKTVQVVNPGPTVTQEVTTTVVSAVPAPTPTSSSSKSTSSASTSNSAPTSTPAPSSISKPIETPKPIFITVTMPKDDGPTEYYDNGLWHTNYRIKTFEAPVATVVPSVSTWTIASSTARSVLATAVA
jgi:hypothetical protein